MYFSCFHERTLEALGKEEQNKSWPKLFWGAIMLSSCPRNALGRQRHSDQPGCAIKRAEEGIYKDNRRA